MNQRTTIQCKLPDIFVFTPSDECQIIQILSCRFDGAQDLTRHFQWYTVQPGNSIRMGWYFLHKHICFHFFHVEREANVNGELSLKRKKGVSSVLGEMRISHVTWVVIYRWMCTNGFYTEKFGVYITASTWWWLGQKPFCRGFEDHV